MAAGGEATVEVGQVGGHRGSVGSGCSTPMDFVQIVQLGLGGYARPLNPDSSIQTAFWVRIRPPQAT